MEEEFGPDSNLNDIIISEKNKSSRKNPYQGKITLCIYLIIFGVILCLIMIALIIIILLPKNSNESKKELKRDGEIKAIYNIDQDNQEILILGQGFKDLNKLIIYINDKEIQNSEIVNNKFKFNSKGVNTIKYRINNHNDFEMEKMFENVINLKTIEMNSEHNINLKSINNAFNGCINLETFKMKGFNTSEIKSFEKLFYKTNISYIDLKENFLILRM